MLHVLQRIHHYTIISAKQQLKIQYDYTLKVPPVLLCIVSTALTGFLQIIIQHSALPHAVFLLNMSPCVVYYVHSLQRRNNYVEYGF